MVVAGAAIPVVVAEGLPRVPEVAFPACEVDDGMVVPLGVLLYFWPRVGRGELGSTAQPPGVDDGHCAGEMVDVNFA